MDLPEVTILNFRQTKQNDKNEKDYYIIKCKIDTLEYNHLLKIPNEIKNLILKLILLMELIENLFDQKQAKVQQKSI